MKKNEFGYYEQIKNWDFSLFDFQTEKLTNWNIYEILKKITNKNSKILDLGTGGGEKLLKYFPKVKEILGTDFSSEMIKTANKNLEESKRKNIFFKVMNNLKMDTHNEYYDVVVARNTVIDSKQIYKTLNKNGCLLIHGVDKYDCWELKKIFGKGQGYFDERPISIIDYENVLDAGFKDVELIPIHERQYLKTKSELLLFLLKVPIIDDFCEENKDYYKTQIDEKKLDKYIERNSYDKGIRIVRRYYGIVGKK